MISPSAAVLEEEEHEQGEASTLANATSNLIKLNIDEDGVKYDVRDCGQAAVSTSSCTVALPGRIAVGSTSTDRTASNGNSSGHQKTLGWRTWWR